MQSISMRPTATVVSYVNYYHCPKDGVRWADWSCMCNDKCPICNAEIEPYRSDEINAVLAHEFAMQC
jgi:transcription initiation factor IIE alpha subunit